MNSVVFNRTATVKKETIRIWPVDLGIYTFKMDLRIDRNSLGQTDTVTFDLKCDTTSTTILWNPMLPSGITSPFVRIK